jgi:erythromycin esterase-like protein
VRPAADARDLGGPGDRRAVERLRALARPLGRDEDLDAVVDGIGEARVALIGEATHGTEEFYRVRAAITRRLVERRGVRCVALEADWPDAYRINRYVRGELTTPGEALSAFERFPRWMWRNRAVVDFVAWLRGWNDGRPDEGAKCGVYGLDLYNLYASIEAVVRYLDRVDPAAARAARERYACLEHFEGDPQAYGLAALTGAADCEEAVARQLVEMMRRAARHDGHNADDALFYAEQNAKLVVDAERYYRELYRGGVSTWNLRDRHMAETLDALLARLGPEGKAVVWAHNSHVGDARATAMGDEGELTVGQLARERYGERAYLIGFGTHAGTVTAASDWDGPAETKEVRPSLPGSYEALCHAAGVPRFWLALRGMAPGDREALAGPRLERAIGVVYRPRTERASHYFACRLPDQFDAWLWMDETRALEPLDRASAIGAGGAPDTYPAGV